MLTSSDWNSGKVYKCMARVPCNECFRRKEHFTFRSSHQRCSVTKVFIEISHHQQETPVPEASRFIKKETLAQVFACKFYEISINTFLYRTSLVAASAHCVFIDETSFLKNSWIWMNRYSEKTSFCSFLFPT